MPHEGHLSTTAGSVLHAGQSGKGGKCCGSCITVWHFDRVASMRSRIFIAIWWSKVESSESPLVSLAHRNEALQYFECLGL